MAKNENNPKNVTNEQNNFYNNETQNKIDFSYLDFEKTLSIVRDFSILLNEVFIEAQGLKISVGLYRRFSLKFLGSPWAWKTIQCSFLFYLTSFFVNLPRDLYHTSIVASMETFINLKYWKTYLTSVAGLAFDVVISVVIISPPSDS